MIYTYKDNEKMIYTYKDIDLRYTYKDIDFKADYIRMYNAYLMVGKWSGMPRTLDFEDMPHEYFDDLKDFKYVAEELLYPKIQKYLLKK